MKRLKSRSNFLKAKNDNDKFNYNKQRNICVFLTRKEETKYYANLNVKYVAGKTKFWKPIKPCFSDKSETSDKEVLIENDKMVTEDNNVAFTLNTFSQI